MASILVVDDEPKMCQLLQAALQRKGHTVRTAAEGGAALALMEQDPAEIIFTDLRMSPVDGMEVLRKVRELYPRTRVVMITAHGEVESAVSAMKLGAYHYLTKPIELEELTLLAQRMSSERDLEEENERLKQAIGQQTSTWKLKGESTALRQVQELILRVAPTDATVLIRGESGTGKELTARAIHANSTRAQRPFVAVNCAAIPDSLLESELFGYVKGAFTGADADKTGLFEAAHTGTIFLDEIAEANASVQAKLLRALEERKFIPVGGHSEIAVDVRILGATNKPLEKFIEEGRFREDLFYRFNVFPLQLPPLRERLDDLAILMPHFLSDLGRDPAAIDPAVLGKLRSYPWPGNVRELRNILERAHILAGPQRIEATHVQLPDTRPSTGGGGEPVSLNVEEHERRLIQLALKRSGGNKTRAAEMLGLTRRALYSRMERLEIPIDVEGS